MTLKRFWWGVGLALVAFVVIVCLVPNADLPSTPTDDKLNHFIAHFVLAAWFAGLVPRNRWWLLLAGLLVLGAGIEIAQSFMRLGREGDVRDELANFVGNIAGIGASWLGLARWPDVAARLLGRRRVA
jgi:VanZ family protein